jgi:hypothetical protein
MSHSHMHEIGRFKTPRSKFKLLAAAEELIILTCMKLVDSKRQEENLNLKLQQKPELDSKHQEENLNLKPAAAAAAEAAAASKEKISI